MTEQLISELCMTLDSMGNSNNQSRTQAEAYLKQVSFLSPSVANLNIDAAIPGIFRKSAVHHHSPRCINPSILFWCSAIKTGAQIFSSRLPFSSSWEWIKIGLVIPPRTRRIWRTMPMSTLTQFPWQKETKCIWGTTSLRPWTPAPTKSFCI